MRAIAVLAFLVFAVTQFVAACVGIEHHLGGVWAFLAVAAAFVFRFTLPITIGAFFGARDVWHWHWVAALIFAAPGLAVAVPALLGAVLDWLRDRGSAVVRRDASAAVEVEQSAGSPGSAQAKQLSLEESTWSPPTTSGDSSGWGRVIFIVVVSIAVVAIVVTMDLRARKQWSPDPYPYEAMLATPSARPIDTPRPPASEESGAMASDVATDSVEGTTQGDLSAVQPVDLGILIEQLMIESGAEPMWAVLAEGTGPVLWVTDGVEDYLENGGSRRRGVARVTVDGKVTTVLRRTLQEVPWDVVLMSAAPAKFGPQYVHIEPQNDCFGTTGSGCDFEVEQSLRNAGVSVQPMCERRADGMDVVVYALVASGQRTAWLAYFGSGGSGGASNWLSLFWRFEDIDDDVRACMAERLPVGDVAGSGGMAAPSGAATELEDQAASESPPTEPPTEGSGVPGPAVEQGTPVVPELESEHVGQ